MSETLEELKAIVAGKPEGVNFVEDLFWNRNPRYLLRDEFQWFEVSDTEKSRLHELPCFTRSLSDIERIIELMEKVESLEEDLQKEQ